MFEDFSINYLITKLFQIIDYIPSTLIFLQDSYTSIFIPLDIGLIPIFVGLMIALLGVYFTVLALILSLKSDIGVEISLKYILKSGTVRYPLILGSIAYILFIIFYIINTPIIIPITSNLKNVILLFAILGYPILFIFQMYHMIKFISYENIVDMILKEIFMNNNKKALTDYSLLLNKVTDKSYFGILYIKTLEYHSKYSTGTNIDKLFEYYEDYLKSLGKNNKILDYFLNSQTFYNGINNPYILKKMLNLVYNIQLYYLMYDPATNPLFNELISIRLNKLVTIISINLKRDENSFNKEFIPLYTQILSYHLGYILSIFNLRGVSEEYQKELVKRGLYNLINITDYVGSISITYISYNSSKSINLINNSELISKCNQALTNLILIILNNNGLRPNDYMIDKKWVEVIYYIYEYNPNIMGSLNIDDINELEIKLYGNELNNFYFTPHNLCFERDSLEISFESVSYYIILIAYILYQKYKSPHIIEQLYSNKHVVDQQYDIKKYFERVGNDFVVLYLPDNKKRDLIEFKNKLQEIEEIKKMDLIK
ncbi:hypothetical protein J3E07_001649 [Methanococcus voltae]|uniref:Uncharacterized protein n=1 Tax=Methanococcus voltae TaxID=2188 RepID=A0A8J7UU02_METVO|nr:hypothetical protein [Methanococcus voltae]MBP2202208.1 hypothetical protein [Methanococcus voltae]